MPLAVNTLDGSGHWLKYGVVGEYPVGASQTIKRGDFLCLTAGFAMQFVTAATTSTLTTNNSSTKVLGVALGDLTTGATTSNDNKIEVAVADDEFRVALRLYHATSTTARFATADTNMTNVPTGANLTLERWTDANGSSYYVASCTSTSQATTATSLNTGTIYYHSRCLESAITDRYGFGWFGVPISTRALGS